MGLINQDKRQSTKATFQSSSVTPLFSSPKGPWDKSRAHNCWACHVLVLRLSRQEWRQIGVKTFNWRALVLTLTALPNRMSTWIKLKFRSQACHVSPVLSRPPLLPVFLASNYILLPAVGICLQSVKKQRRFALHDCLCTTDTRAQLNPSTQSQSSPPVQPSVIV